MKFVFLKFEIFYENHPPTRQIKYKKIDFVPCNKSIMANELLLTNLDPPRAQLFRYFRIESRNNKLLST